MFKQKPTLPTNVRVLPKPAQIIFSVHYKDAIQRGLGHELATELAWQAVQKVYVKGKRHWIKRRP